MFCLYSATQSKWHYWRRLIFQWVNSDALICHTTLRGVSEVDIGWALRPPFKGPSWGIREKPWYLLFYCHPESELHLSVFSTVSWSPGTKKTNYDRTPTCMTAGPCPARWAVTLIRATQRPPDTEECRSLERRSKRTGSKPTHSDMIECSKIFSGRSKTLDDPLDNLPVYMLCLLISIIGKTQSKVNLDP